MTAAAKNWFEVDRAGLAKLLEKKGKQFAIYELVQNAWDAEGSTCCRVTLTPVEGQPLVKLFVTDDAPDGFKDMSHAFTLFAESEKKGDVRKRGRFNLGEKLVLALCVEASVCSTKGTYYFGDKGRIYSRLKTAGGTEFRATIRMTREELDEVRAALTLLLPPSTCATYIDGVQLQVRPPVGVAHASLPTEAADADGVLRKTARLTDVRIIEPASGTPGWLYELGIPVVETDDRWHLDVQQKVPLNFDRDNVSPSYLRQLRTLVANFMAQQLTEADVNTQWVRDATSDPRCAAATMERVLALRYGDKRVAFDPSDLEANHRATAAGYAVIHGGALNSIEWEHAREAGVQPAGRVFPTHGETVPSHVVPASAWTPAMRRVVDFTVMLGDKLLNEAVTVCIVNAPTASTAADWLNLTLRFNVGVLGAAWFEGALTTVLPLVLHELGHHDCSNHLDDKFADAIADLGAKAVVLALTQPKLFEGIKKKLFDQEDDHEQ